MAEDHGQTQCQQVQNKNNGIHMLKQCYVSADLISLRQCHQVTDSDDIVMENISRN